MSSFQPEIRFPRSNRYDAAWVRRLEMGPHPLWQLEDLLVEVPVEQGQRVLDLGAGLGATSVFLARECGAVVDSYDLWVEPERRAEIVTEAGVEQLVTVRQGDVRTDTLEPEHYDVIISVDAWEYFGTDVRFLRRLLPALKPQGRLGFSTPMLRDDPYDVPPDPALAELIGWEIAGWHSPAWWRRHAELTGDLDQVRSHLVPDSLDYWIAWERAAGSESDLLAVLERLRTADDSADGQPPVLGFGVVSAVKPPR